MISQTLTKKVPPEELLHAGRPAHQKQDAALAGGHTCARQLLHVDAPHVPRQEIKGLW